MTSIYLFSHLLDYLTSSIPSVITFQSTESMKCFNVTVVDDLIAHEQDETVVFDLLYPGSSGAPTNHPIITIVDNDGEN